MKNKIINEQQLLAICDILADTSSGLTKKELEHLLQQCQIKLVEDGKKYNGYSYSFGLSKKKWLFNCFVEEINKNHSTKQVYTFLEKALNPINFVNENNRKKFDFLYEGVNKVLLLLGLSITKEGKIIEVTEAKTLDEVDRRVNELKRHLYARSIHSEVTKYCINDYLRKDYYDTVFEAAKGLAKRVREISGLGLDGSRLFGCSFFEERSLYNIEFIEYRK